jgi:putative phosphoesterase
MRLLAFTDLHESTQFLERLRHAVKTEQVDLAVCAGDFTTFSRSVRRTLQEIDRLGVPVVLIHGNHDDEDETMQALRSCRNISFVHMGVADIKGYRFMGFGGGGFSRREPELEEFEAAHAREFDERTIFLCHAPPYGTALDEVEPGWHVGSESLRELIKRRRPLLVISGHIHECFHAHDSLAGTTLINPGPDGEIIELD